VQVDPIKPTLKAPGTKRLKLTCDVLLSTPTLKFNLRRYAGAGAGGVAMTLVGSVLLTAGVFQHAFPTGDYGSRLG